MRATGGTRWTTVPQRRAIGLEWLHRLLLEPGRLWRRYLLGIPRFLWAVWRERRSAPTT
ncbi:MAG: hypothetical protein IPP94_19990 [Ignavibacteria bacterium]|nr:hypothetical protein [Ignavibacteria bacterium]